VVSDLLQAPNATLVAAHPPGGLPQLQSELFGSVSLGYGDLFVAALLGAVLADKRRSQRRAALLTLVLAGLFDLLFLTLNELPATVPVALALIVIDLGGRLSLGPPARIRSTAHPAPDAAGGHALRSS
jgi:predicted MFS family arabinose efflux permease